MKFTCYINGKQPKTKKQLIEDTLGENITLHDIQMNNKIIKEINKYITEYEKKRISGM